jgi:16S rRNA (guanine527-N7)-methyltransferase
VDEAFLERWLEDVVSTPGLTSLRDAESARRVLLDDALRATALVEANDGEVADVGSGGGSPGVPLAVALPARTFTLLEAERRKCAFLERATGPLANVRVVCGRAEEQAPDRFGVALAKALAKPPTAAELCLALVRPGGAAILWVGESVDVDHVERVAGRLAASLESAKDGILVIRKHGPTPSGFPRRPVMAKKRPL